VYSSAGGAALERAGIVAHVTEVPHGCVPIVEVSPEDLARVRDRYAITSPLVLSLGFAHPDKGTELLVDSVSGVTRRLEGTVQFLFAGSPRERRGVFRLMGRGDQRFHRAQMKRLSLMKGVSIGACGFVPDEDVPVLLSISAAVVLPYRRSTQSGIANLALSARAVIVASDIPELRSDLGPAARYFHSESISDLTETLVSVLSNSQEELRNAAGSRAAERSYDTTALRLLKTGLPRLAQPQ
jgi:glycosyltransferase involved in cell wall biosynthesis